MGVELAGGLIHARRTPGENPVWIPTEEERDDIAQPLARIAARHAPVGDVVEGDVGDAIEAGVATTAFALRSRAQERQLAEAAGGNEQWRQQHEQGVGE